MAASKSPNPAKQQRITLVDLWTVVSSPF